jgi:hypothetical protein
VAKLFSEGKIMASASSNESIVKEKLTKNIMNFNDGSKLDFTESYLKNLSIKRLKHILLFARTMRIKKKN